MKQFSEPLAPAAGFMFDVDGTLILSDRQLGQYEVLPGAIELLGELDRRGLPFLALTNGSAYPSDQQAAKLRQIGLPIADEQMLTPNSVAAHIFKSRGIERVMVLGNAGVCAALEGLGIEALHPGSAEAAAAQAVYVAWYPECSMTDIHIASEAVLAGAGFYTASDVPFFATKSGRTFGYSCAIVGAIERVTGKGAEVTGKPSLHALGFVSQRLGVPTQALAVIGDDPRVEIEMARAGGAIGIGVTSGTTSAEQWAAQPLERRPHRVIENLAGFAGLGLIG